MRCGISTKFNVYNPNRCCFVNVKFHFISASLQFLLQNVFGSHFFGHNVFYVCVKIFLILVEFCDVALLEVGYMTKCAIKLVLLSHCIFYLTSYVHFCKIARLSHTCADMP